MLGGAYMWPNPVETKLTELKKNKGVYWLESKTILLIIFGKVCNFDVNRKLDFC